MKYRFIEAEWILWYDFPIISFEIVDEWKYKWANINHLSSLCWGYVKKIVEKMDQIRAEQLDIYGFWEDSIYVEVAWPTFHKEEFRNKCYITKAFDKEFSLIVPFEEIYNLMRDYRDEIVKWEEKTGMKKPGEGSARYD